MRLQELYLVQTWNIITVIKSSTMLQISIVLAYLEQFILQI